MDLLPFLRTQARANRLANRRLHAAMAPLAPAEFHAPRTSFFPSLGATLNHILVIDIYYLDALEGRADMGQRYDDFVPAAAMPELVERQRLSDERLIAFCDGLTPQRLDEVIAMDRGELIDHDAIARVLAHVFMHQTHHRGQVHAMLAGTAVKPPQLDEFLLASDARLRGADMTALGWSEAALIAG